MLKLLGGSPVLGLAVGAVLLAIGLAGGMQLLSLAGAYVGLFSLYRVITRRRDALASDTESSGRRR
ncbi:MAG TPA: hypothetical protein VFU35_13305 [Jatrophihabitans sp.]|nr:hypothetical protein [Jatrophihabitans sp.]